MSINDVKTRPTRVVHGSRAHDHLYDPTYTMSSCKDHQKIIRGQKMSSIERVPVFTNLFSSTGSYPQHSYRLKRSSVEAPVALQSVVDSRSIAGQEFVSNVAVQTSGKQRYLFFNRPLIPYMQTMPAEVILEPVSHVKAKTIDEGEIKRRNTRTVGVQTMYRDSQVQTDPFSPGYVIDTKQPEPDILMLSKLRYGRGLPANLDDIKVIENIYERRAFERSLPNIETEVDFDRRKRMLERREMKEWQERQNALKHLENTRLQILIDAIRQRENAKELTFRQRIQTMRENKARECDDFTIKMYNKKTKAMRKISRMRNQVNKNSLFPCNKRDIIDEYSNYSSKVYAPMTRDGGVKTFNFDNEKHQPETFSHTYKDLVTLEASIPSREITFETKKPISILPPSFNTRKGQAHAADLNLVDELLQSTKMSSNNASKASLRPLPDQLYLKNNSVLRPTMPIVEHNQENASLEASALLLQQLLRGRAVQNAMFEHKEASLDLIEELCYDQQSSSVEQQNTLTHSEMVEVVLQNIAGSVLSFTLDFLAKDVIRRQEIQRLSCLMETAHLERVAREAQESGSRQAETLIRGKQEAQYKQITSTLNSSIRFWVDDVIDNTLERMSAQNDMDLKTSTEETEDEDESTEKVVHTLLADVTLPLVEKRVNKLQDSMMQARYVNAAHEAIQETIEHALDEHTHSELPQ